MTKETFIKACDNLYINLKDLRGLEKPQLFSLMGMIVLVQELDNDFAKSEWFNDIADEVALIALIKLLKG